jgi:O-antigen ligase
VDASSLFVIFGGVVAGNVLVAILWHWFRAIAEVVNTPPSEGRWRRAALTSLFNSGPWVLLVVALFMYYEHSAPWAPWFFGGAIAWAIFMSILVGVTLKRFRNRGKNAA